MTWKPILWQSLQEKENIKEFLFYFSEGVDVANFQHR